MNTIILNGVAQDNCTVSISTAIQPPVYTDPVPLPPTPLPPAPQPVGDVVDRGPITWGNNHLASNAAAATDSQRVGQTYCYWLSADQLFNPIRLPSERATAVRVYDGHTAIFSISLSQAMGDFSGECKTIGYPGALNGETPLEYRGAESSAPSKKLAPPVVNGPYGPGLWLNVRCDKESNPTPDGLHSRKVLHYG